MNKQQIKAELLRSACDNEYPYNINQNVWDYIADAGYRERFVDLFTSEDHVRTFFLLCAEAL